MEPGAGGIGVSEGVGASEGVCTCPPPPTTHTNPAESWGSEEGLSPLEPAPHRGSPCALITSLFVTLVSDDKEISSFVNLDLGCSQPQAGQASSHTQLQKEVPGLAGDICPVKGLQRGPSEPLLAQGFISLPELSAQGSQFVQDLSDPPPLQPGKRKGQPPTTWGALGPPGLAFPSSSPAPRKDTFCWYRVYAVNSSHR